MKPQQKNNRMADLPVQKLMISMGIPMILSMMLQALYNIVDSAFVSNMPGTGEAALNALTLAFPMQMLMVAIGIGTGVGVNALTARSLGQNDREKASRTAGNGIFLSAVIYAVFLLFGIFGVHTYIATQTQNPEIAGMASDYLTLCCCLSMGIVFFSIFEKLLQATGNSLYSTIAQIAGAVANMILDPLLIYGMFGFPELGITGAALATVIGQLLSAGLGLFFHVRLNRQISNSLRFLRPRRQIIGQIYAIGLPAIIAQALMSLMTYGLNIIMGAVSETMVTAYGLYYKIQQFILFAAFGLRDAITPILSFAHGRKDRQRIAAGIRCGVLYTLAIMLAGLIVVETFATPFATVFGLSGETEQLCVSAMHIISLSFLFAGINIALQGIFQALDGGLESLIISVCRQFLFVLPAAYALAQLAGTPAHGWYVWLTFPLAEAVTAVIGCGLLLRICRKHRISLSIGRRPHRSTEAAA